MVSFVCILITDLVTPAWGVSGGSGSVGGGGVTERAGVPVPVGIPYTLY